jgi:dTDP-glucose pyrophosphorylase/CBS domain-containing protein
MTLQDLDSFCLQPEATIEDVIQLLDRNRQGVACLIDKDGCLLDIVTDGDLRRAFHGGFAVTEQIGTALPQIKAEWHRKPLTAPVGTEKQKLLDLLEAHHLRHIPLLDENGRVADIAFRSDLMRGAEHTIQAVIMAGGQGSRLRPLTENTPKPMLPVGDRPLLEHLVNQIHDSGIRKVNITTHYHREKIQDHFGDGESFDIDIEYVSEKEPLGTAGALRLLKERQGHILVINGDILTNVNFRAMVDFHQDHQAGATIGVTTCEVPIPFGVIETKGSQVTRITEKPTYRYFVNAGIYVLDPKVIDIIPAEGRTDMTELVELLIERDIRVVSFPITEYWLDVGRLEDFEKAQEDLSSGEFKQSYRAATRNGNVK